MKVHNVHERELAATPEAVAALFADMGQLWPTPTFPAPEPEGDLLRLGPMLWQPVERAGAARAYEIVGPKEFPASHWFEVDEGSNGGTTTLRHTVEGEAVGDFGSVWRERVEPMHNAYIEAMFDRAQEALA
jgi:hypothetical protein